MPSSLKVFVSPEAWKNVQMPTISCAQRLVTANDSGNDILAIRAENESPAGFKWDKENQSYFNPAGAGNCTGVNQCKRFIYFFVVC